MCITVFVCVQAELLPLLRQTYELVNGQDADRVQALLNHLEKYHGTVETDKRRDLWWETTFEDWETKVWKDGLYDVLHDDFAFTRAQLNIVLGSVATNGEYNSEVQSEYKGGGLLAVSYLRIISYKVAENDKRIIGLMVRRAHFKRGFIGWLIQLWTIPAQEIINALNQ